MLITMSLSKSLCWYHLYKMLILKTSNISRIVLRFIEPIYLTEIIWSWFLGSTIQKLFRSIMTTNLIFPQLMQKPVLSIFYISNLVIYFFFMTCLIFLYTLWLCFCATIMGFYFCIWYSRFCSKIGFKYWWPNMWLLK